MLTPAQVDAFARDGFCGPLDLAEPAVIGKLLDRVLAENTFVAPVDGFQARHVLGAYKEQPLVLPNVHLSNELVLALGRDPAIIAALGQLMGPEVYLRRSQFWRKPVGSRGIIWHQDVHRKMGLGEIGEFSAWVALEDSTVENGCVWFMRGSHLDGFRDPDTVLNAAAYRVRFFASDHITVPAALRDYQPVAMPVREGQFFLFHQLCFHASGPNRTSGTRTGVAFRYLTDPGLERVTEELTRVI
jgi:chlorinating enzyme